MRFIGWLSGAALAIALSTPTYAQIGGKVVLEGQPPEIKEIDGIKLVPQCAALHKDPVFDDSIIVSDKGELANAIVFIKEQKEGELKGPQKQTPIVLDQKGCMYSPHVVAMQTNQPVIVKNSDSLIMHNVHSLAIDNPTFNFAQVSVGEKKLEPFTAVETFPIKCDVHPWMKAIVRVFDNPYFAVSSTDGKFTIDTTGLKDGSYTVQAWHEVYKDSQPQKIEVKDGKADKELTFTFRAKPAK